MYPEDKTPFKFYNVIPYSPGAEDLLAEEAIEYTQRTGNDTVLYTLTLHPEGYPAFRKVEVALESYRKLKKALEGSNVKLGVLFQSILGHWPRTDKNEESWTRSVDSEGKPMRFCSFDPDYRKYIFDTVVAFAKEDPVFLLGDDDIRSFSPNAECFCPLHTAEFNRRMGTNYTQDEFRQAVRDSKPGDAICEAFIQLQRDTVNGVGALIREALDSVDPSIPGGSCMPGWEIRFNHQTSKAFAGKNHPPVMRIANANYCEGAQKYDAPYGILKTQAMVEFHKNEIPRILDESDTCPHNLYSRSATTMNMKLCTSIMSGVRGSKIWYVNAHKMGFPIHRNYTDIMAEYKEFYQELARTVENSVYGGLVQPGYKNFPTWHPVHNYGESFIETHTWAERKCGWYGIPFHVSYDFNEDGVYLLAGENAVARYSDDELKQLLSRKILVDGNAAMELTKRGFAEFLGVKAEDDPAMLFNRECHVNSDKRYVSANPVPRLTILDPAVEVMTEFRYAASAVSTEFEYVAPATVFYKNTLGGHVCTAAFHTKLSTLSYYSEIRKDWMLEILDKLSGGKLPFAVKNEQNFMAIERKLTDGATLFAAYNINYDPVKQLMIRCAEKPVSVQVLTPAGVWQTLTFNWDGDSIILDHAVPSMNFAVLKIR